MADPNQNIRTYNGIKEELITGLNNLRENGDLFDVTVVIGGQPFKAHKAVLASLSSYFQVMFTNPGFVDCNRSEHEIKEEGLEPESFSNLLKFMYTGQIQMDDMQTAIDLLHIAGFLQVKGAVKMCVDYLMEVTQERNVPFETAFVLSSIASRLNHPDLKNAIDRYVGQSMVVFSETKEFLAQMTSGYLKELLSREDLNQTSSEEEILQVVVDWLQYKWEDRQKHAANLMSRLRLSTIPNHAISDIVEGLNSEIEAMVVQLQKEAVIQAHRGTVNQPLLDTGYEMRLELGHKWISQRDTDDGLVVDWTVWVKGPLDASKIDQYVERVGFSLPNADEKVVTEAPFETVFSARHASVINIPIHVYFKNPAEHKRQTFQYTIKYDEDQLGMKAQNESTRCEKLIFWKPCEDFRKMLINAGGAIVAARDASFQVTEVSVQKAGYRTTNKYDYIRFKDTILSAVASASISKKSVVFTPTNYPDVPNWHEFQDGVEFEDEVDFGNVSHKVLTNLPRFLVAQNNEDRLPGWRLARHAEVRECLELVKLHLSGSRRWYICRLQGGKISGSGYHFEMDTLDHFDLGHRLMIKYPPEFSVTRTGKLVDGWRVATCKEAEDETEMVAALLKGKRSKYECLLEGGKISCTDSSGCEIRYGTFMGLKYQVLIRI